jgi:hypothetical protein
LARTAGINLSLDSRLSECTRFVLVGEFGH